MSLNPIAIVAVAVARRVFRSFGTVKLESVQDWITQHSDKDRHGAGYSGSRVSRDPSSGYVEVLKRQKGSRLEVTATVYLDPRQGAVASKTWTASKLDSGLEKFFGRNLRVRIEV